MQKGHFRTSFKRLRVEVGDIIIRKMRHIQVDEIKQCILFQRCDVIVVKSNDLQLGKQAPENVNVLAMRVCCFADIISATADNHIQSTDPSSRFHYAEDRASKRIWATLAEMKAFTIY